MNTDWIQVILFSTLCLTLLPMAMLFADKKYDEEDLKKAAAVSDQYVIGLDSGKYDKSWDEASKSMQLAISKEDWVNAMEKLRKPLGSMKKRTVGDIRVAKDPHGVPKGDYTVVIYNTSFNAAAKAYELVTLQKQNNGEWKVFTYQVSSKPLN